MLPKPGSGETPAGFVALANWATRDLSLARLVEGHVEALAILEEAGHEPDSGATYGVWAARQPAGGTTARLTADGWLLTGEKPFCSGSTRIDRALVTAEWRRRIPAVRRHGGRERHGRACRIVARGRDGGLPERDPRFRRAPCADKLCRRTPQLLS